MATSSDSDGAFLFSLGRQIHDRLEDHLKAEYGSQDYFYKNLLRACYNKAESNFGSAGAEKFDDRELTRQLDVIDSIVRDISFALTTFEDIEQDKKRSWYHPKSVNYFGKNKTNPYIDSGELQSAATRYLQGDFRCQALDRVLVDLLISQEFFAYINDSRVPLDQYRRPLLASFVLGRLSSLLWLIGIWTVGAVLESYEWISDTTAAWLIGVPTVLIILGELWSLWAVVRHGSAYNQGRKAAFDALRGMEAAYFAVGSDGGLLSVSHVHGQVKAAADKGVVWLGSLYALLEDIEARSKTF